MKRDPEPQYIILFPSGSIYQEEYKPIVEFDRNSTLPQNVTYFYGLDETLITIVPALWYCLHLPRTRYDLRSVPIKFLKKSQEWELAQNIRLIPVPCPEAVCSVISPFDPSIAIYPDDISEAARAFCRSVPKLLDMAPVSTLSSKLLKKHWMQLRAALTQGNDKLFAIPPLFPESPLRSYILPIFFLDRQLTDDGRSLSRIAKLPSKKDALNYAFKTQTVLSAFAQFEVEGVTNPTPDQCGTSLAAERRNFKCPVSVCVPGKPPSRLARILTALSENKHTRNRHGDAEMSVLSFLVAHRALARGGYAVLSEALPNEAFSYLAQLESMWSGGSMVKPRKIVKIMAAISNCLDSVLDEQEKFAILHGSSLTVFTEFPIGLATIRPDTSPLACRMPVAYRPLTPLTRALQFELSEPAIHYVGDELRVLIAECIPEGDAVGKVSRLAWRLAKESIEGSDKIRWLFFELSSVGQLKAILAEHRSDILVISAHGHFDRARNCSGFICGHDFVLDQELGELPPVTILSSCQIWPRGSGTVSVADLLVRQGAIAVIGTLIPIDVRRNALLMTRFFVNIRATLEGEFPMRTVADVWHHTATSNAVNDILDGNKNLSKWAHEGKLEQSVIYEFMRKRSVGRLRGGHIYKDSEEVLLEIAKERGIETTFRAWMKFPGYVPESVFYSVIGWPERIVVQDPLVKELVNLSKTKHGKLKTDADI